MRHYTQTIIIKYSVCNESMQYMNVTFKIELLK